ncbi:MAG: MerR family transcriptional regulator [Polyangiaceae bacterium]|nr:MerR family transcriptional regulator [Polyangiaceae bacterium]
MFSIGEFSTLTALTVKTLRHYHDKGLLMPSQVDSASGYRSYDKAALDRARLITALKQREFSLEDIRQILEDCGDDGGALEFLERHRWSIRAKLNRYRDISNALERTITLEKEARSIMQNSQYNIEDKFIAAQLVAGIRGLGEHADCELRFKKRGRAYGFGIAGKPDNSIYDSEYKQEGADFESFFPVKKEKPAGGIDVHSLVEVRCLTLVHRGPYDTTHRSYARLFEGILVQRQWLAFFDFRGRESRCGAHGCCRCSYRFADTEHRRSRWRGGGR